MGRKSGFPLFTEFIHEFTPLACTIIGLGLLKRRPGSWKPFLGLNWIIVVGNGVTLWYAMKVHVEMKHFLLWLGLPMDSVMELIRYLEFSDYFQMILFSGVHLWIIWRFLRSDIRHLFFASGEKNIEIEQGIH